MPTRGVGVVENKAVKLARELYGDSFRCFRVEYYTKYKGKNIVNDGELLPKHILLELLAKAGFKKYAPRRRQLMSASLKIDGKEQGIQIGGSLVRQVGLWGAKARGDRSYSFEAGVKELDFHPWWVGENEKKADELLHSMLPYEKVIEASEQNDWSRLPRIKKFIRGHGGLYGQLIKGKRFGAKSLSEIVNSLHPGFSNLYSLISHSPRCTTIDLHQLKQNLENIFWSGGELSPSGLDCSKGALERSVLKALRELVRQKHRNNLADLTDLAGGKGNGVIKHVNYGPKWKQILKNVDFKSAELTADKMSGKMLGDLTERYTRSFFLAASLLDKGDCFDAEFYELFPTSPMQVVPWPTLTDNGDKGKRKHPDLLVFSPEKCVGIEAKAGRRLFHLKPASDKYSSLCELKSKEIDCFPAKIDYYVNILHMPEKIAKEAIDKGKCSGYKVVTPDKFLDWFEKLIRQNQQWLSSEILAKATPRIHDVDALISLYKEAVNQPYLLSRRTHSRRLASALYTLESIVHLLEKKAGSTGAGYSDGAGQDGKLQPSIDSCLDGAVESIKLSRAGLNGNELSHKYYRLRTELDKVNASTASYVNENLKAWQSGRLKAGRNEIIYVPLEKALFIDIETVTPSWRENTQVLDPIFLVGFAYYNSQSGSFVFDQYLARDLCEEEAMLNASLKDIAKYKTIISYNGKRFDLPRMQKRARAYLLKFEPKEYAHLDLWNDVTSKAKKALGLKSTKLKHLEEHVLHFKRKGDIDGAKIYPTYTGYQNGESPEKLANIVSHNLLDLAALAAAYIKALRDRRFTTALSTTLLSCSTKALQYPCDISRSPALSSPSPALQQQALY
jgi:uncharacterized protein YprB with RNaseH-like and TPR domain